MMRKDLPAQRAGRSPDPTLPRKASSSWRTSAIALAAALSFGLPCADAWALALGRVSVQSSLGEPLRAEVDIPQITPDEVAGLRANLGSPEDFRAAGMQRNPSLADLRITLQQRPNGSYFLRLSGDRAVTEPFVDMVLEAIWPAGRVLRGYTMLFDPPATRPAPPVAAQVSPAPAAAPAEPAAAQPAAAQPGGESGKRSVTVQSGQTAGQIAAAAKPATVSLDQMLVAMLRANPDAFADGNVNRLKAGALIELPSQEQALAVSTGEARETIVAQSRDFSEFRRRLADNVATTPAGGAPGRQASGRIQAQVQEKKPADASPDRLSLSKGAVAGANPAGKSAEDRIVRERDAQDMKARMAELNRNLKDLSRLSAASGAAASASAASGAGIAGPAPATAAAEPASAPASRPSDNDITAWAANMMGFMADNPLMPAAAGSLLAMLAAVAVLRLRRGKRGHQVDSSFLESRLQPDSFFGASGGQRIDTAEGQGGSAMVYSPSQIDAAGDVDPVAEADVYLAYGRDLQAEEILKEALRTKPDRVAIHAKLLEIYARRRDLQAFEKLATEAHGLTGGSGPEWVQIANLGLNLDPDNRLYQGASGTSWTPSEPSDEANDREDFRAEQPITVRGQLPERRAAPPVAVDPGPATQPIDTAEEADEAQALAAAANAPLDVDLSSLDLDFTAPSQPAPTKPRLPDLVLNLAGTLPPVVPEPPVTPLPLPQALMDLNLEIPSLDLDPPVTKPEPELTPELTAAESPLSDLPSLGPEIATDLPGASTETDPLATKLALADEFKAIGDIEGARSLAEEVRGEAKGELRQRAERLLGELG